MLHTQQSVQQRSSVPTFLRDSLHTRDQQQHHHAEGYVGGSSSSPGSSSGSPHKGSKGSIRFKRRGVVADVCWMLRIRTFQVGTSRRFGNPCTQRGCSMHCHSTAQQSGT